MVVLRLAVLAGIVYLMRRPRPGPSTPSEVARAEQRHGRVQLGHDRLPRGPRSRADLRRRDRVAGRRRARRSGARSRSGAACAFLAAIATLVRRQAVLDAAAPLGAKLEAITGFIAIVVLLVVMNWFVHKVYWSEWIGRHHRQRARCSSAPGSPRSSARVARLHERLPRGLRGRPLPPEPRAARGQRVVLEEC